MLYPWFENAANKLAQALQKDRLAHGLMISASQGSGKLDFANSIAQSLLCNNPVAFAQPCHDCKGCHLFQSATHPDFYLLDKLVDAKGKQKKSIGIDQVRQLSDKLVDTAQLDGWRVAIIAEVNLLSRGAYNALLKTLEEPKQSTLLILITSNLGQVPATIKSRCQLVTPDNDKQIKINWIKANTQNADQASIEQALESSYGSPLHAKAFLENNGLQQFSEQIALLDALLANKITPQQALANLADDDLQCVNFLSHYFFNVQKSKLLENHPLYRQIADKSVQNLFDKCTDYRRAQFSGSNLQPKLQLQAILIPWFEIGKKLSHNSMS
ncbi:hypothetical protein ACUR5C_08465 [Aliikangiella sp. IMCC44653]